jgi:uncharacterized peroxidase-related enzyme
MPDTHHSPQPAPSWLDLPLAPSTPELDALFDRTREKLGYVRHSQRATAHRPALTLAQDALSRAVNSDAPGSLCRRERELIALVVSTENRCIPCVFGHAAALREASGDPAWVAQVEANFRHAGLSARERALADFALLITRTPGEIEAQHLEPLRAAGLTEEQIVDAAAVAAYFNFSNRLNSALGVPPNLEAYAAHRGVASGA